jgi:hypothetical protein
VRFSGGNYVAASAHWMNKHTFVNSTKIFFGASGPAQKAVLVPFWVFWGDFFFMALVFPNFF